MIGACIDGIGDETRHPSPPDRLTNINHSAKGWGLNCDYSSMKQQNKTLWNNQMFPLYDGADFRRRCGTRIRRRKRRDDEDGGATVSRGGDGSKGIHGLHNAFHFHNWFATVHSIRHKYGTYGHAQKDASHKRVKDFTADTAMMYQCALGRTEKLPNQKHGYELASDLESKNNSYEEIGFVPIYFQDADYVRKRHNYLKYMIFWDETQGPGSLLTKEWDHSPTKKYDRIKKALHGRQQGVRGDVRITNQRA